jgi:hypothetical protein
VTDDDVYRGLKEHLSRFFPKWEAFSWNHGPVQRSLPNFRVVRAPPLGPGEPWVYASLGAWEATKDSAHGTEFFLLSPRETPYHVETLAVLADYHADHPVRLGQTLDLGRPWIEGAAADHVFVTLPYPFGPDFEHFRVDGRHVEFRWLLPITAAEARFLEDNGLEAFEQLLEESGADFADPKRAPLV